MKKLQVSEFKSNFSEVLNHVRKGGEIAITYGKKKETVAVLIPFGKYKSKNRRKLGLLENKASFIIKDSFEISDEELVDL